MKKPLFLAQAKAVCKGLKFPTATFDCEVVGEDLVMCVTSRAFWSLGRWHKNYIVTPEDANGLSFRLEVCKPLEEIKTEMDVLHLAQQAIWLIMIHEADEFFYYNDERVFDPHKASTRTPRELTIKLLGDF